MSIREDDLGVNNLKILQDTDLFCFGVDSVLLSNFVVSNKSKNNILDLGTGSSVIPILLSAKVKFDNIYGLELQDKMYELALRNVELNNLENKIKVTKGDIKEVDKYFEKGSMDIVTSNPPYKPKGTGVENDLSEKTIARHEILCTLEDVIKGASYVLKDLGKFYLVHKPERLVDIFQLGIKYKLEPKRLRMVQTLGTSAPSLVLVECIKGAKREIKIEKPLVIYSNHIENKYTDEILGMYNNIK